MKLKKIKKALRIYFPKKDTSSKIFENRLRNNDQIVSFKKEIGYYIITLKNGTFLKMRDENFSDYLVFEQIYNFKEYEIILSIIRLNNFLEEKMVIIDAGANVGYTSMFFNHFLDSPLIYAIEPSLDNFLICKDNFSLNNNEQNMYSYQRALSHEKGLSFNLERDFRDGKDWSITTKNDVNGKVNGITLNEIITENDIDKITVLKIDIEGAERFIFDINSDVSFLNVTKIITIEIHDEFNLRDSICSILKSNNFYLLESGELTIGVNINFL